MKDERSKWPLGEFQRARAIERERERGSVGALSDRNPEEFAGQPDGFLPIVGWAAKLKQTTNLSLSRGSGRPAG